MQRWRPDRSTGRHTTCRELIANAIGGRARESTKASAGTADETREITTSALARHLDDRFSIPYRRRHGDR